MLAALGFAACGGDEEKTTAVSETTGSFLKEAVSFDKKYYAFMNHYEGKCKGGIVPIKEIDENRNFIKYKEEEALWEDEFQEIEEIIDLGYGEKKTVIQHPLYLCFYPETYNTYLIYDNWFYFYDEAGNLLRKVPILQKAPLIVKCFWNESVCYGYHYVKEDSSVILFDCFDKEGNKITYTYLSDRYEDIAYYNSAKINDSHFLVYSDNILFISQNDKTLKKENEINVSQLLLVR